jgi:putative Mn2+ efflux pump MntP
VDWPTIVGIAFGLAADAFAVSVAASITIRDINAGHVFRLSWHFGFFQFMMPVIGWFFGRTLHQWISYFDHWIAFVLLAFIGGKMLWESFSRIEYRHRRDPTRGWLLIALSIATSIDALAAGLSLAFLNVSIWVPSVTIGVVAATMTAIGMKFGSRLGVRFGKWAEMSGGLVLAAIGVRILVSHIGG